MDLYQLEDLQREALVMSHLLNEHRAQNFRHNLMDDNVKSESRLYSTQEVYGMVNPYNL